MNCSNNALQSVIERTNWIVTHLSILPDNYALSNSSFEVNDQNVYTIASRIFTCNKVRSVHVVYDDDNAICNCNTPLSTKFVIRLFQAPEHTGNVLVEIRRKAGCSLDFQQEYRALFQAATYGEAHPREYPFHKKAMCMVDKGHTGEKYIPLPKGIIERSLEMAQNHLRLEHYDAQMLVLKDLALTTDPSSTETASIATKLIFQEYTGILEFVINVITQKMVVHDDDDDERNENMRSGSLTLLRNLLTVSLQDIGGDDNNGNGNITLQGVSLINNAFSKETLVQSLLQDVKEARNYPWNACLAAKCLALLVANFVDIKLQVGGDRNAFNVLNDARIFGNASYSYLKQEVDDVYDVCYGEQKEE
eukprot:CAMPEP_0198259044 /NCGR_PEP_ID=MMETSP1447-20131203/8326_1 /TAXON_ID=420782 /ORGANISM="Chaetoceros dichaeta, Strain CCMP1751" /LENGTH=362 /DNA_ID=CAMNT_0043946325 /DNA_START=297 /DNA_END=1385 /DNA_ORIENTATION=+